MVGRRDVTLTGQMSHYKGACGLEEHVECMSVREGEAKVAYTGGCADGVGGVVGRQHERSMILRTGARALQEFSLLQSHLYMCTR